MWAAVQESTRDIGLRKAVGATEKWIMIQFLVQTIAISGSGAILGIIVGTLIVETLKRLLHTAPDYGILTVAILGLSDIRSSPGGCCRPISGKNREQARFCAGDEIRIG